MATTADIQNWFKNNPGATDAQIYAAMAQNNVTPELLQQAMGGNLAEYQQRYRAAQAAVTPTVGAVTTATTASPAGAVTTADIQNWFKNNPGATDAQIYAVMQQNNVTPEAIQQAMGGNLAGYQQRYRAAQTAATTASPAGAGNAATTASPAGAGNASTPLAGAVTAADIQNWFRNNPGATDEQIYAVMRQYNVTPEAIQQAMGGNLAGYQQRYNAAQAEATPTGLVGYEQAAEKGLSGATSQLQSTLANINNLYGINITDLQNAAAGARGDITKGYGDARGDIAKGYGAARGGITSGYGDARGYVTKGYGDAKGYITKGYGDARGDVTKGYGEARGYFQPFYQGGQTAYQKQMALSGALGQDAFNAARQESPYEQFLFDQGMRANLAGASATGGLGGGNVQKELQRFGQGLASQGLQQQIGNLNTLSGYGFQGAGALGNLATGEAGMMGDLATGEASALGNLATGQASALGNLATGEAGLMSNLLTGEAGIMGNLATGQAGALADIGLNTAQNIAGQRGQQAGYEANVGTNIAQMRQNTGQNIASNRMSVGEMIARQQENAALQQANLLQSQGMNMSNLYGTQGQNLINLGQNAYDQYIQDTQNEAMTQADLYLQQGNVLGGQPFAQADLTQAQLAQPQYAQQGGFTQAEFAQAPPMNYSGMASDALNAAGTGYYLGQRMQNPTTSWQQNNTRPGYGPSYAGQYQRPGQPFGQASTGIPGMRPINYLTGRVSP